MVFTVNWGIIGTGSISRAFVKDLLIDPDTRDVSDIAHRLVAVGSRTVEKALQFSRDAAADIQGIKAYGSYQEVADDPDVDIVYIGSLNNLHYRDSLMALRAKKHVLCEKGFTINSRQARHLARVADENSVLLMEAAWTRFLPISYTFQKLLHEDKVIGAIRRVSADCGHKHPVILDDYTRTYSLLLGGGSLLNLGVYAVLWVMLACYHHPENNKSPPSSVKGLILKEPNTGVDESAAILMTWEKPHILSVSTSTVRLDAPKDRLVCVEGDLGQIVIPVSTPRPEKLILRLNGQPEQTLSFPIPGNGMGLFYEADAAARDIRDGKLVDERSPLDESILVMDIFDEVRKQNGLQYPSETEYCEDQG